jgi:CRISPR-associated protein Cas1
MIKRSLYFGNPAYLHLRNNQLIIKLPEVEKNDGLPESFKKEATTTIPVEDIGVLIIDNGQVTITQGLMAALLENNTAVIVCNETHHPTGLLLPLSGNTLQSERFKAQIEASEPLKKQLWQQTITGKINNQAALLKKEGKDNNKLNYYSRNVKSGDPDNVEGRASYYYWSTLFPPSLNFSRKRDGDPPNNLLNYGYAILRAITARNLVGSGLLPTLGIHHRNRYNAYCLADDIMEPYRPFVDEIVLQIIASVKDYTDLTTDIKKMLLGVASADVQFDSERSPLMVGMQRTTASLVQCFEGKARKIIFPSMIA